MSFLQSNLASNNFITNLTGTNGIATTYDAGTSLGELYYTIDSLDIFSIFLILLVLPHLI